MIYLIGNAPLSDKYVRGTTDQFMTWIRARNAYQLDVETPVSRWWCERRLITLQFGSVDGKEQWVIQWSALSPLEQDGLRRVLEWQWQLKVIHNAMFECVVCLFHGIRLRNVFCTMLAEMILYCGKESKEDELEDDETDEAGGFFSLTELNYRYRGKWLNKEYQMSFGDDILTEGKVLYAAADVVPLGFIKGAQLLQLHQEQLEFVAALEMEVVLGYAEMTWKGMEVDPEKWLANLELAGPVVASAKAQLDTELLMKENPFLCKAMELKYVDPLDRVTIKWGNHKLKRELVNHFFPFLNDRCSTPVLRKMIDDLSKKGTDPFSDPRAWEYVQMFYCEDWPAIEKIMVQIDRDWLIEHNLLIPGGQVTINWNSTEQVLPIMQCVNPKLKSLDKKNMGNVYHPIAKAYKEFKESLKLTTTYGHKFIDEHVEPDGKVRTSFNQILTTGRISSRKPNMQNIPVREPIGTRYRNAFICDPGHVYVSGDYASQELVIIATLSGDPVWMTALHKHQDLHSICAELVFTKEWKAAAEADCAYYEKKWYSKKHNVWSNDPAKQAFYETDDWHAEPRKNKCKCKGHKKLREPVKNIDFGMAYGMSKFKLAGDMRWTIQRADSVIINYFRQFPKIGGTLTYLGRFGLNHGYIMTIAPFFRKRWFPKWAENRMQVDAHIADVRYNGALGSIERESKNMPIQGTSADITKLSLCMLYWKIHDELHCEDDVYLAMQIHDQNDTVATDRFAEEWQGHLEQCMVDAGLFIIPNGLLRVEAGISPVWTK